MDKMLKGLDIAAEAVGGTLGPKGLNAYLDDPITPRITNDGATIANHVKLEDKEEDAGAYVIRNTTSQTNDDAGDGTTTTAVLVQAIIHECLKRPENASELKVSLKEAGDKVLKLLAKQAIPITQKDVEKVAYISAEDQQLAKLISEIVNKLGKKAVINVEDSKTFATEYEIVDGYEAAVGFLSPHFINDKKAGKSVFQDVRVLVADRKIQNVVDIQPLFEQLKKENISQLVIACEDIDDAILGILVMNKNLGNFNSLVIKANQDELKDIEGTVGATMVSASTGVSFQNIKLTHLGTAKKVVSGAHKTLFIGNGTAGKVYAAQLEKQAENEPNRYVKQKMEERVARLRGGIAVLRIGAPTDFEREYLKLKAEDAVKAAQAALEEGVVEGGGMTLWRIALAMKPKTPGEFVLKKALTAPLRKICENAGLDYAEIVANLPEGKGYDAKNDTYVDMVKSGLVDPAKVERVAVENSVSAAATFITTFAVFTEVPTKNDA